MKLVGSKDVLSVRASGVVPLLNGDHICYIIEEMISDDARGRKSDINSTWPVCQ